VLEVISDLPTEWQESQTSHHGAGSVIWTGSKSSQPGVRMEIVLYLAMIRKAIIL